MSMGDYKKKKKAIINPSHTNMYHKKKKERSDLMFLIG